MAEKQFRAGIAAIQTTGNANGEIRVTLSIAHEDIGSSILGGWLLEAKRQGNLVDVTISTFSLQASLFDAASTATMSAISEEADELGEMEQDAAEEADEAADAEESALAGVGA